MTLIKIICAPATFFCLLFVVSLVVTQDNGSADIFKDASGNLEERSVFSFLFGESCPVCRCGIPNRQKRILGGEYMSPHEFPWLVQINIRGLLDIAGALISDRYVLTTASGLVGLTPYEIKVVLGRHDRCNPDVTESQISVEEINLHPDFGQSRRLHDISILRLSQRINFGNDIAPICLPRSGTYLGKVGTIAGWNYGGAEEETKKFSCEPRKIGLPILSKKECPEIMAYQGCIGVIGAPNIICAGDAGTPIQYRGYGGSYEFVGVLTDKADCRPPDPNATETDDTETDSGTAIFIKISDHINWILNNVRNTCFCTNN